MICDMKNRQVEVLRNRIVSIVIVIMIVSISIYIDYNFENGFINGIMLFMISVFALTFSLNQSFYIETGLRLADKESEQKAYIYAEMHYWTTTYNLIIYLLFYLFLFISLIFIIFGVSEVIRK